MRFLRVIFIIAISWQVQAGEQLYQQKCASCHGEKGEGIEEKGGAKLSGQFDWYIETSIADYNAGKRDSGEMAPFIKDLTGDQIKSLANYISKL